MYNAFLKDIKYDSEDMKLYLQEKLILEITECIAETMQKKDISKSELAKKLGRTKGYITQLLNGNANMTLKTISDVLWALDSTLKVNAIPSSIDYAANLQDQYDISESYYSTKAIRAERADFDDLKLEQLKIAG